MTGVQTCALPISLQDVVDHIEITLCRNFGEEEHPFTYPLNRAERDVLRGEMEACCQLRTGRTLAQHYNHLLVQEEVEPPELAGGQRRIPLDKVSFAEISSILLHDLDRGVTGIHARGMYEGKDRMMLFCVVGKKQIVQLKEAIAQVDPGAFVIVTDAREVLGERSEERRVGKECRL